MLIFCLSLLNLACCSGFIVYFIHSIGTEHPAVSVLSLFGALVCGVVGTKGIFEKD